MVADVAVAEPAPVSVCVTELNVFVVVNPAVLVPANDTYICPEPGLYKPVDVCDAQWAPGADRLPSEKPENVLGATHDVLPLPSDDKTYPFTAPVGICNDPPI